MEMFAPLSHAPGHAQCDFGEALMVFGGVERKVHCFVIHLPHSDGCFLKPTQPRPPEPSWTATSPPSPFWVGCPGASSTTIPGWRWRRYWATPASTYRSFTELHSLDPFEDRFGRPSKGKYKGKVGGLVGYSRRDFLVPVPSFESFGALNAYLERRCLERRIARLPGHADTIGQRMKRDLGALLPLPPVA